MIKYPIKFKPILHEKIWGGNKLKDFLNKETESNKVGESWEISSVEGQVSKVKNGSEKNKTLTQLIAKYKRELVGDKVYDRLGNDFPLLIKFIDAKRDLSVQLHPNDKLAKERHNSFGKTEMWYVMQADAGSKLNIGFKKSLDKKECLKYMEEGEIIEILNFEEIKKGDAVFINTGKVHAIGSGFLLAEIQQTSDVTYRIYDWDRVDEKGNSRELHAALILDVIDFEKNNDYKLNYRKTENAFSTIASCEYFTTNFLPVIGEVEKDYSKLDTFVIYMCVDGEAEIAIDEQKETIKKEETILILAAAHKVQVQAKSSELLEVYI